MVTNNKPSLECAEICAGSLRSALHAGDGGARRIELCSHLEEGGLTPSYGMACLAREKLDLKIFVLIRPRTGHFVYDQHELDLMVRDIELCKSIGIDGIVTGCLNRDLSLDYEKASLLLQVADPLPVVFHRAIDETMDPLFCMEQLIEIGYQRILTSGGALTAWDGRHVIREMVNQAQNRIEIMAGAGIRLNNVDAIVQTTGVRQIHTSASIDRYENIKSRLFWNEQQTIKETSVELVSKFMMYQK